MKIAARAVLGLAATFAFSSPGRAQDAGGYLGVSAGQAKYRSACPGTACENTDGSWRLFGGYQFNRYFSAELGYADLGRASASGIPGVITITTSTSSTLDTEATAWDLVGVGALPLSERWSLTGKLGLYQADVKSRRVATTFSRLVTPPAPVGTPVTTESSVNDSGVTFGLGVRYDFTRHFGVRAEWQRYGKVGTDDTAESDIDVLSAGVLYRF
jgi:OOP family OmpA-OmpF porin